jgi:hypothetical protein
MGHSAVPGHFQYCINGVLRPHKNYDFSFADDIIVGANTPEELKANNEKVLRKLMRVGFRVNAAKCQLFPQSEIKYLGWIIKGGEAHPEDSTLEKLWSVKRPCDLPKASDKKKRKIVKRVASAELPELTQEQNYALQAGFWEFQEVNRNHLASSPEHGVSPMLEFCDHLVVRVPCLSDLTGAPMRDAGSHLLFVDPAFVLSLRTN